MIPSSIIRNNTTYTLSIKTREEGSPHIGGYFYGDGPIQSILTIGGDDFIANGNTIDDVYSWLAYLIEKYNLKENV